MPEKTQKRKLRSDQSTSHVEIENYNYPNDENASLSEQDFEDISSKVENRLLKRLRDTEFGQREILRLIENLTSKVDSLSNPASEQCSSALRYELDTDPVDNSGNDNANRNVGSNSNVSSKSFDGGGGGGRKEPKDFVTSSYKQELILVPPTRKSHL